MRIKKGTRRRKFKGRRRKKGVRGTFRRNLNKLARTARTTQERVDAQDAIAAHNRRGDITNAEAERLLASMRGR